MSFTKKFYEMRGDILNECLERMQAGAVEYADRDMTANTSHLMGRDILIELEQELLDQINYSVAQIVKIRLLREAIEYDPVIQRVAPSGKPKARSSPT